MISVYLLLDLFIPIFYCTFAANVELRVVSHQKFNIQHLTLNIKNKCI